MKYAIFYLLLFRSELGSEFGIFGMSFMEILEIFFRSGFNVFSSWMFSR